MTVRWLDEGAIALEGICVLDDAEPLLRLLSGNPSAAVDWRNCESAHAAILQLLMVSGARLIGPPASPYLRDIVGPALKRSIERGFPRDA